MSPPKQLLRPVILQQANQELLRAPSLPLLPTRAPRLMAPTAHAVGESDVVGLPHAPVPACGAHRGWRLRRAPWYLHLGLQLGITAAVRGEVGRGLALGLDLPAGQKHPGAGAERSSPARQIHGLEGRVPGRRRYSIFPGKNQPRAARGPEAGRVRRRRDPGSSTVRSCRRTAGSFGASCHHVAGL